MVSFTLVKKTGGLGSWWAEAPENESRVPVKHVKFRWESRERCTEKYHKGKSELDILGGYWATYIHSEVIPHVDSIKYYKNG